MQIYLASRFIRREELRGYRERLQRVGHTITSRWLVLPHDLLDDEEGVVRDQKAATYGRDDIEDIGRDIEDIARDDIEDIIDSEAVIVFTGGDGPRARGGYHVEFGYALALGLPIALVGPRENVFHWLTPHRFDTFEDVLDTLENRSPVEPEWYERDSTAY